MAKKNQLLSQRLNHNTSAPEKITVKEKEKPSLAENSPIEKLKKAGVKPKTVYTAQEKDKTQEAIVKEQKNSAKKNKSPLNRMRPVEPKIEKEESPEEKIRKLYTEPSLNEKNALPKIKKEDEDLFEQELEKQSLDNAAKMQKREKRKSIMKKISSSLLVCFSFYLIFLIYGTCMTNYEYDDSGNVVPCVMTVEEIKQQKEFYVVQSYYEETRSIYEQIYMLDYRLSLGEEDPLILAPEYEAILEQISAISATLSAAEFSSKYTVVQTLMLDWIQNHSALYVQNMSSAISTNNNEAANHALQNRANMLECFNLITDNLLAIGNSLNGVYTDDISSWSLDNFIYEQIYGEE